MAIKNKIVLIICTLLLSIAPAYSATLKGGYVACLTENLLDQIMQAVTHKDERGFEYLLKHGCIITKSGIEVSVLDTTWTGKAKVRAYVDDQAIILWTLIENIKD